MLGGDLAEFLEFVQFGGMGAGKNITEEWPSLLVTLVMGGGGEKQPMEGKQLLPIPNVYPLLA